MKKSKKYQDGGGLPSGYHATTNSPIGKKKRKAQDGKYVPESADVQFPVTGPTRTNLENSPKPMSWDKVSEPKPINWGNVAGDALLAFDAILPPEKTRRPLVRPLDTYNQYPYGTGSQAIYEDGGCMNCGGYMEGGKVSKTGYKRNSKDKNAPFLNIPSNNITMENVDFPVYGVDNAGNGKMMFPGRSYQFPGDNVTEYPIKEPGYFVGQYGDHPKANNGGTYPFGEFIMPTPEQSVPKFQVGGAISAIGTASAQGASSNTPSFTKTITPLGRVGKKDKAQMAAALSTDTPFLNQLKSSWNDANKKFTEYSKPYEYTPQDYDNSITLSQGKYNSGKLPKVMVDRAEQAAKKNNIDTLELLGLAGQESTFGRGYHAPKGAPIDERSVVSGWDLATKPQDFSLYLANNKVPGVKPIKNKSGYSAVIEDQNAVEQYLAKNPKLIDTYKTNLSKIDYSSDSNYFDLAAQRIKKQGIKSYNPGDPDYPNKVAQSTALLKKDDALKNYLATNNFKQGGWIIPTGVESNLPYSKETMEYGHGGTIGENLQRDISPSGRIKAQKDVYNPLFQAGGIIPGIAGTMYSRNAYKPKEHITETMMGDDGAMIPYGNYMMEDGGEIAKGGNWIKGAVNPKHKGYCTPMTKSTCTPRRKAFAKTMKKHHGFHKKAKYGDTLYDNNPETYYEQGEQYDVTDEQIQHLIKNGYDIQLI